METQSPASNSSSESSDADDPTGTSELIRRLGRFAGPLVGLLVFVLLGDWTTGLAYEGQATAAIGAWMAVWWMTEAVPLAVTSLLPLILFPLTGVLKLDAAAAPYADKNVFLFLGGFMVALAVERWNLHRRIALLTVLAVGTRPDRLVGGVMLATSALSMWISNTATASMMLPIGLSLATLLSDQLSRQVAASSPEHADEVVEEARRRSRAFATCLMLGIAYSASIGGLGTLIGTPTNVALAGFAAKNGLSIGFGEWMLRAAPLVLVFEFIAWVLLTKWLFPISATDLPGGRQLIQDELRQLGPLSRGEKIVLAVFASTALAWVFREPITKWSWLTDRIPVFARLDDPIIALLGATALFLIPIDRRKGVYALDWNTASKAPLGILLLFGGGFALTAAMTSSGLTEWLGQRVAELNSLPTPFITLAVIALVIFTTELTSNTPTLLAFLPILHSVAKGLDIPPLTLLIPATMAASCAFMLPVGTPPNAIVFASGRVTIGQMVRAGWYLNLIGIALIYALTWF
jgi:sodium-dependent dicarboxylate transporter 2/3/5